MWVIEVKGKGKKVTGLAADANRKVMLFTDKEIAIQFAKDKESLGEMEGISSWNVITEEQAKLNGHTIIRSEPQEIIFPSAVVIAQFLHKSYEKNAEASGWETQVKTRVSFDELPEANRQTMIKTSEDLLVYLKGLPSNV